MKVLQTGPKVIRPSRCMPLTLGTSPDDCIVCLTHVWHTYSNPVTRVTGFFLCQLILP